jgi:hypothetical protein
MIATIPDGRAPAEHPIRITAADARAVIARAIEHIADLHTLVALAWIAEQIAKGTIQKPAHPREDHDCVDVFTGFDLAASDARRAIHSALCMIGLRTFERGLKP